MPPADSHRIRRVGRDRVEVGSDRLVVITAQAMPGWRVGKHRRTAVFYDGNRWVVRAERSEGRRRHVYELEPWPDDGVEAVGRTVEYDEHYARLRDRQFAAATASSILAAVAVPITPLLGFLPARTKSLLQATIGVHPESATRGSILIEVVIAMLCGAFAMIHVLTFGVLTPEFVHVFWLGPLVAVDAVMRFGRLEDSELDQPGFLEWLLPGRLRGHRR